MASKHTAPHPTDDFSQLQLRFTDPIQYDYEAIRPIVLFAETVTQRSEQIGLDRTTISDKARCFITHGMLGLRDHRTTHSGRQAHTFPDPVASYILYLKQLYPPIHLREIVRIVERTFGYQTNHHTIKHFLERHPIPVQLPLELTTFHQFDDAYRARWTVVRMSYEGWQITSIAGCLKLSRKHVHHILAAFERDGFAGLEDQRTRPPDHPANQLTLPLMHDIRTLQRNYPRAGRFRVRGLLAQRSAAEPPSLTTIGRAMAKNRQFHGAPGPWMRDRTSEAADGQIKRMLYQPDYRHQYWFIDIRYLVKRDGHWIYSICILEGYSRKLLAGMASEYQDLIAVLQLLAAALTEYGRPMGIVSDNGAVFTAQTYRTVLETLDIRACYIEKGKPWQNLIEAQFKIQLRLVDHLFAQAPTNDAIQTEHARFIELFNTTAHGAHQDRDDDRRTPLEVLGWVRGQFIDPATLRAVFRQLHVERTVNRQGSISIQRFYIYAERGLARQRVSIWLYEGQLQIEYQQTMLARYAATYDRKHTRVRTITQPQIRRTSYADAQLELWELDDTQWRKVLKRPLLPGQRTSHGEQEGEQLPLPLANLMLVLICAAVDLPFAILLSIEMYSDSGVTSYPGESMPPG